MKLPTEITLLDFPCSRCKVGVGQECVGRVRGPGHAPRVDRKLNAQHKAHLQGFHWVEYWTDRLPLSEGVERAWEVVWKGNEGVAEAVVLVREALREQ